MLACLTFNEGVPHTFCIKLSAVTRYNESTEHMNIFIKKLHMTKVSSVSSDTERDDNEVESDLHFTSTVNRVLYLQKKNKSM